MTQLNNTSSLLNASANQTAENTQTSVVSFFEKVVPVMHAIMRNSRYLAAKNAIDYVQTDNPNSKEAAKQWIARSDNFKNSLNWFMNDPLMSKELKEKYQPTEEE